MDVVEAYNQLPVVTRYYVTLCVVTTAACALDVRISSSTKTFWNAFSITIALYFAVDNPIPHLL